MGLEHFIQDDSDDSSEGNIFLDEEADTTDKPDPAKEKKDRIVRAEISLARHYENVTEEEAEELHKEWVYEMARAIEEEHQNIKLTDWTALNSTIYVPGEDHPDPFWLDED